MAFNNTERVTINTNSVTFFDPSGVMLKMSFFDESMAFGLWTPVEDNGKRTYPKDKRETCVLSKERIVGLYKLIIEKALPAYRNGSNYNGGVFTSMKQDNVLEVRVENGNCYVVYYRDIDENRKPKRSIVFSFQKTPVIEKYNPDNGEFELPEVDADFAIFTKVLEAFVLIGISGASAHSNRYHNRFANERVMNYLNAFAAKFGITINTGYNSQHQGGGSAFSTNSDASSPTMSEIDSLDGIIE